MFSESARMRMKRMTIDEEDDEARLDGIPSQPSADSHLHPHSNRIHTAPLSERCWRENRTGAFLCSPARSTNRNRASAL